jgi:hypothetical protein
MRSRLRDPRLLAVLSGVLVLVALLVWGVPWLTRERPDLTSTPTPPPFSAIAPITLPHGQQACENAVALSPDTRAITVLSGKHPGGGVPLDVVVTAPGYRGTGRIPGGYLGAGGLTVTISPPPPRNAIGTVCLRNAGRRDAQLQGTVEGRIQNRSSTAVAGKILPQKMTLLLTEGRQRSLGSRLGEVGDRIAAFKPPFVNNVTLALLALLVLVGAPAGVLYAIATGVAADDDAPEPER